MIDSCGSVHYINKYVGICQTPRVFTRVGPPVWATPANTSRVL